MPYTSAASPKVKLRVALGLAISTATLIVLPSSALGQESGGMATAAADAPTATTPDTKAKLVNGLAVAPAEAPRRVVRAIEAANRIEKKPYLYGGGHRGWNDRGYDCSGAVSYALGKPGARVLDAPMPSGSFENWAEPGPGRWITTYANGGHMYVVIAGLRWDTANTPGDGPGWSKTGISPAGYKLRHPTGF